MMRHGSVVCPTMFLASLNIKTAFDGARPRHVAKNMESHDKHGWLIAAFLREMSWLEGKAMFECVAISAPRKRRSSPIGACDSCTTPSLRGGKVDRKHGSLVGLQRREGASDMQHYVGRQILDCPTQKKYGTDARRLDQVLFSKTNSRFWDM